MELPLRWLVLILIGVLLNAPAATFAQESFYQGKTLRIIVGTSVDGTPVSVAYVGETRLIPCSGDPPP